jgi:hypothetical protein|tara:strand:+ start:4322 stop:4498 length:177 start_codon:yes stop_codon:yes gene_type:complete
MCILKFLQIFFANDLYDTSCKDIKTETDIDIQQILDNQYDEPPSYTEAVKNSIILEKV